MSSLLRSLLLLNASSSSSPSLGTRNASSRPAVLARVPSVRGTTLCSSCHQSLHIQSTPEAATLVRQCTSPADCDICSKLLAPERLIWTMEANEKKKKLSQSRCLLYRAQLHVPGQELRQVAVKTFRLTDREEFEKEMQIHCQLRHPNLLPLLGYCVKEKLYCLVLPFKTGGDLKTMIHSRREPLPLSLIRRLVTDIVSGLEHLHNNHIVHRDLKPANVLLNATQTQACLSDFGSARYAAQEMTCLLAGTVAYMAPEMFREPHYTAAVDMYSLGVIIWEMYTRQEPWRDLKMPITLLVEQCVKRGERPPLPLDTPAPLRELIEACWATRPSDRPSAGVIRTTFLPRLDPGHHDGSGGGGSAIVRSTPSHTTTDITPSTVFSSSSASPCRHPDSPVPPAATSSDLSIKSSRSSTTLAAAAEPSRSTRSTTNAVTPASRVPPLALSQVVPRPVLVDELFRLKSTGEARMA